MDYLTDLYIKYAENTPYKINKQNLKKMINGNSFYRKIFSLKNSKNKKHKILTICGIKMKFRRKQYA